MESIITGVTTSIANLINVSQKEAEQMILCRAVQEYAKPMGRELTNEMLYDTVNAIMYERNCSRAEAIHQLLHEGAAIFCADFNSQVDAIDQKLKELEVAVSE